MVCLAKANPKLLPKFTDTSIIKFISYSVILMLFNTIFDHGTRQNTKSAHSHLVTWTSVQWPTEMNCTFLITAAVLQQTVYI